MWPQRLILATIFLFGQLLFLADVLNRLDEDPELDVEWAAALSITIGYLAVATIYILGTIVYAGWLYISGNRLIAAPPFNTVIVKKGQQQYQQNVADVALGPRLKRKASLLFGDLIIDGMLWALGLAFLVLLIIQLDGIEASGGTPPRSWGVALIPAYLFFGVLLAAFAVLAVRVSSENRYERELDNTGCCGATFGGIVACCPADRTQLDHARDVKYDKKAEYFANNTYHQLPCAFLCTPSMAYGWVDLLLGWVWYIFVIASLVSTILLAVLLDSGAVSLASVFIPLWIVEGFLLIFGFMLLLALCCCFRRATSRPVARSALFAKYIEGLFAILTAVLFAVQQILLVEKIEGSDTDESWQVIFLPLYIFAVIVVMIGCCYTGCCTSGKKEALPFDNDGGNVAVHRNQLVEERTTSTWGVFNATE